MTRRRSIEIPGFAHRNPVPAASRIGPFLVSGALTGIDPESGAMPEQLDAQIVNFFGHVEAVLAAAGGTLDDVLKLTFWLVDPSDRAALNREWLARFPDGDSRPARQVIAASLGGGALVHGEVLAVLER